jgi:hypothetical protein
MNGFLAVGSPSLIYHSFDAKTWTQVFFENPGRIFDQIADDGNGTLITGPVNVQFSTPTTEIVVSHDDGVTWTVKVAAPVMALNAGSNSYAQFGVGAPANTQAAGFVWDGSQFVIVGNNVGPPFLNMFSPDGNTWQIWVQNDVVNGYVPGDVVFFGGVYVGYSSSTAFSLLWSPTAGKNAGPQPTTDWTVGQIVAGPSFNPCLKTNGSYVLAFVNDFVYKTTDGKTWVSSLNLNGQYSFNGKDSIWWDATLNLWILCGGDNNGQGLFTSTDGLVWTPRLYDPAFVLYPLVSVRRTGWFLSAVGLGGAFYISTDGISWTLINANCPIIPDPWDLSFIHSTSNYFIAYGVNNGTGIRALITSPDGISWTARQIITSPNTLYNLLGPTSSVLLSYIDPCNPTHIIFPPTPPPPPSVGNNNVLLRYMGSSAGFSLLTSLPNPPNTEIITLREVQAPIGGTGLWAKAGDGNATMMALTDDAKAYILFAGTQDGTVTATAVTQPLPTPGDLAPELWNSAKIFRSIYVEGEDLGNFQVFYATDHQLNPDGTVSSFPWGPFSIINNKVDVGAVEAKQIVLKFVHAAACAPGVTPLLTYINIDYDITQQDV